MQEIASDIDKVEPSVTFRQTLAVPVDGLSDRRVFLHENMLLFPAEDSTSTIVFDVDGMERRGLLPSASDIDDMSPDGNLAVLSSRAVRDAVMGSLDLWDLNSLRRIPIFQVEEASGVCFLSNQTIAIGSSEEGRIKVFDLQSNTWTTSLVGHTGSVWSLRPTEDGSLLTTAAIDDDVIRLWDLRTCRCIRTLDAGRDVRMQSMDGQGRWIATAKYDDTFDIWDVGSGRKLSDGQTAFPGSDAQMHYLAFNRSSNTFMAIGGDSLSLKAWAIDKANEAPFLTRNLSSVVPPTAIDLQVNFDDRITSGKASTALFSWFEEEASQIVIKVWQ